MEVPILLGAQPPDSVTDQDELDSLTGVPFALSAVGMLIVAEDGQTILRANDSATAMLASGSLPGRRMPEFRPPDLPVSMLRDFQALIDGELDQLENEITMIVGRGRLRVIRRIDAVRARGRRLFLLQLQDVTEIREQQEVLSASESRYRQLVENLPNMSVLTFDRNLNSVIAAGGVLDRNGYDPVAMVGKYLGQYIPPSAFKILEGHYRGALDGQATDFDYSSPVNGRQYRVRVRPVTGADGSVIGGLALHEDVSEERAARSQLQQIQQLSHVGSCSYVASTGWEFDSELLDLLGVDTTAEGLTAIDLLVVPEDRQSTRDGYRSVLADGGRKSMQYRMRHGRTGELRHVLVACEAVVDSDGKLLRAVVTHADITDAVNSRQLAETAKVASARARSLLLRRFSDALSADSNSLSTQLQTMTEVAAATLGEVAVLRILAPDALTVERDVVAHPDPAVEAQLTDLLKERAASFDPNTGVDALLAARGEVLSSIGHFRWRRDLEEQTGQVFLDVIEHFILAPVRHDGAILGSLLLYRSNVDTPYEVGDDDVIQVLADRVGAAIAESRVRAVVEQQRVEGDAVAHRLQELTSEQRELLDKLADVEERERIHLAEAVHDDPMQIIVAAIMRMDMLGARLGDEAGTELEQLASMLETSVDRLRTLIVALMPPNLTEDIGVVMGNLAEGIFMGTATRIKVEGSWDCELPAGITGNAFRILREGLVNARKHARAGLVTLRLQVRNSEVIAELTDDGVGADSLDSAAGHLGVATMHARARSEGGDLRIESSPGNGTVVRLTLPRPQQA